MHNNKSSYNNLRVFTTETAAAAAVVVGSLCTDSEPAVQRFVVFCSQQRFIINNTFSMKDSAIDTTVRLLCSAHRLCVRI